jgi:hypothetical protein
MFFWTIGSGLLIGFVLAAADLPSFVLQPA